MKQTEDRRIFIEHESGPDRQEVDEKLALLTRALDSGSEEELRRAVRAAVPTYCDAEEVNRNADNAREMQILSGAAEYHR